MQIPNNISNPASPALTYAGMTTEQSMSVMSSVINTPALNAAKRSGGQPT